MLIIHVDLNIKFKPLISDHFMPTLIKSLRSQRVRHVAAGEYHTAVLTEVQVTSCEKEFLKLTHFFLVFG